MYKWKIARSVFTEQIFRVFICFVQPWSDRDHTQHLNTCAPRNHAKLCILSLICLHIAKERPVKRGEKKNCNPNETKKISLSAKKESFFLSIAQKATNWNKKKQQNTVKVTFLTDVWVYYYTLCVCAHICVYFYCWALLINSGFFLVCLHCCGAVCVQQPTATAATSNTHSRENLTFFPFVPSCITCLCMECTEKSYK